MAVSGNDGRLYLLDGDVAQDAALRDPEVQQRRRDRRAGDVGKRRDALDSGARRRRAQPARRSPRTAQSPTAASSPSSSSMTGGKLSLEPAWASRDLTSPAAPLIFNGVVFALSTGEHRPANASAVRAPRARRARCRRCFTRSIPRPAKSCGRAARRSPRSRAAAFGCRRRPGVSGHVRQHALRVRDTDGALTDVSRSVGVFSRQSQSSVRVGSQSRRS